MFYRAEALRRGPKAAKNAINSRNILVAKIK